MIDDLGTSSRGSARRWSGLRHQVHTPNRLYYSNTDILIHSIIAQTGWMTRPLHSWLSLDMNHQVPGCNTTCRIKISMHLQVDIHSPSLGIPEKKDLSCTSTWTLRPGNDLVKIAKQTGLLDIQFHFIPRDTFYYGHYTTPEGTGRLRYKRPYIYSVPQTYCSI